MNSRSSIRDQRNRASLMRRPMVNVIEQSSISECYQEETVYSFGMNMGVFFFHSCMLSALLHVVTVERLT